MQAASYYLAIGMTAQEYWNDDAYLVRVYEEKFEIQRQLRNQELWLQGLYNYQAFSAVIGAFAYGLGGKKGKRPEPYIERPIPITEKEREEEKQRRIKETLAWVTKGQKNG